MQIFHRKPGAWFPSGGFPVPGSAVILRYSAEQPKVVVDGVILDDRERDGFGRGERE